MTEQRSVTLQLEDAAATQGLGRYLANHLTAGTVLLLEGDLGSGKTTLVQGLGRGLGITETIDSPTFTLINEYLSGRLPLYHVDLYRLSPQAAGELYLETYWDEQEVDLGIVAIEWPQRLPVLPKDAVRVSLSHTGAGREATLTGLTVELTDGLKKSDELLADEV